MTRTKYVASPKGPFVLFSMGLPGFEGEYDLWNLPAKQITVYHILVRIKHEMDLLRQRTGEDFYLFGTSSKNFLKRREEIEEEFGRDRSIDILFTVNQRDRFLIEGIREPSPKDLKRSSLGWRKMVELDTNAVRSIPREIHLWGGGRPYYGLRIAEFQYFSPSDHWYLKGERLFYYRNDSPLRSWVRFTMGTLRVGGGKGAEKVANRRILATAKLVHPYMYEIIP